MKTYLKTLGRMFKKHLTRFISIIFIVLIAVGFCSGIGSSADKIKFSINNYYKAQNVSDFIIKSTSQEGFGDDEIAAIAQAYGAENINTGLSLDVEMQLDGVSQLVRLYFLDGFTEGWTVNVPVLKEGAMPTSQYEVVYEQPDNKIKGVSQSEIALDFVEILDSVTRQNSADGSGLDESYKAMLGAMFPAVTVTVTGSVQSPLTFANDGEPSYNNPADTPLPDTVNGVNSLITLDNIIFLSSDLIPDVGGVRLLPGGDIYVAAGNRALFSAFSEGYKKYVNEEKVKISQTLGENAEIITLYDNYSFVSVISYADKVQGIGWVLMVAFLLVTALVVLSNMTRLLEEERSQTACLKTLGYSSFKIVFKYVLFAMIAAGIGGVGAYFVGEGLAYLLYVVFNFSFAMPPMSAYFATTFFIIVFFIIVAAILFATTFSGFKLTGEAPANLLRPKPPKEGKKVFLEKIPLLWNRLSFKYKSTMRNVLRYKSRFFMTVVAVAISMSLVMAGLGILDLCLFGSLNSPSIIGVAAVVIVFAGLLTAVVIYTLTNINVSERNRELATLMVLGYYDGEVAGYIYREIYIDTAIGILFGYPLSALLIWAVFTVVDLGAIGAISWFMWLVAPFIVLLFTAFVTLLLRHRIVGIDMNESLKAIE